jgi:hypothetical protein
VIHLEEDVITESHIRIVFHDKDFLIAHSSRSSALVFGAICSPQVNGRNARY